MIDRWQEAKTLRIDVSTIPNLQFIQSLIYKIQEAKQSNNADIFGLL
jgi:hypothetical protein